MQAPLKAAICEDQAVDSALLEGHIAQSGIAAQCDVFSSAEEFLESFSPGRYEVIFMDIYMGGMPGVRAVEKIRESDCGVVIAFTTSSVDHALEGYRLGVMKYLEKPVTIDGVREALTLALMNRANKETISLLIRGKKQDIPIEDILYFEQQNHAILVHTTDAILKTSQTERMDNIDETLRSHAFLRTHKSYLVNLRYVAGIDKTLGDFVMTNGGIACIRTRDRKRILSAYEAYLFEAARRDAP